MKGFPFLFQRVESSLMGSCEGTQQERRVGVLIKSVERGLFSKGIVPLHYLAPETQHNHEKVDFSRGFGPCCDH